MYVLRGPAHQLAVRMRIKISNNNTYTVYGTRPDMVRYSTVRGTLPLDNSSQL